MNINSNNYNINFKLILLKIGQKIYKNGEGRIKNESGTIYKSKQRRPT